MEPLTIAVSSVVLLLFAHTVADFMFQTDNMAINKSTSNLWLLKHTITYIIILGAIFGGCGFFVFGKWFWLLADVAVGKFLLVNWVAHTITDYITSRITSYYWKQQKRHQFFITIGFDQLAHIVVLVLSYALIIGPYMF